MSGRAPEALAGVGFAVGVGGTRGGGMGWTGPVSPLTGRHGRRGQRKSIIPLLFCLLAAGGSGNKGLIVLVLEGPFRDGSDGWCRGGTGWSLFGVPAGGACPVETSTDLCGVSAGHAPLMGALDEGWPCPLRLFLWGLPCGSVSVSLFTPAVLLWGVVTNGTSEAVYLSHGLHSSI